MPAHITQFGILRILRVESFSARFISALLLVSVVLLCSWAGGAPKTALAQGISLPAEINKSFTPYTIISGERSLLSVTIYNPNAFPLTGATWTDTFPAGIYLDNPVSPTTSCGGTVTAAAGASSFSFSGGTVPAQVGPNPGTCTVTVYVTSTTPGNLINVIPAGGLTSTGAGGVNVTNTTPASATLQVGSVQPPALNKNFAPNTMWAGEVSVLTINIVNTDLNNALTATNLTDPLPLAVQIANPAGATLTNCGSGTLTANPGTSTITLTNATIARNSTCSIRVNVTSTTQGAYVNTIDAGAIQTRQGVTNAAFATATLNVQSIGVLKNFVPATITAGASTPLTITLRNPTSIVYTGVRVTDTLPAPFVIAASPAPVNNCGGTLTAVPGTALIELNGGTIPASATPPTVSTCTIVVQVTAPLNALTTTTARTNTIPAGAMTTAQGISNPADATDTLGIQAALTAAKTFAPATITAGGTSTVTITLRNYTASPLTGVTLTDALPAGMTVVGAPASPQCGGTITNTATSVTITGGTIPSSTNPPTTNGSCTITFQVTSAAAGSYTNTIPIGDVTTTQGATNVAQASTSITVSNSVLPVNSSKSFSPTTISAGGNTRLRIDVTAPADTALTNLSITDILPAGMTVSNSTAANVSNCGSTPGRVFTAPTGATSVTLTGGTVLAGQTCRIDVYVTSSTPGVSVNSMTAANITYNEPRPLNPPGNVNLTVTSLAVSKAFYPPTVNPNGLSRLTITLTNSAPVRLVNVALTDALTTMGGPAPSGVYIAAAPNATTTCGGTLTAAANSQTISLANGIIPAQVGPIAGVCTISVDVQGRGAAATRTNTIPIANVTGTVEGAGTVINPTTAATANLIIGNLHIVVNKAFNPLTVHGGSASVMSIELRNPDNAPLSGVAFTDTMPNGMIIANPPAFNTGTCGGTLTGTVGSSTVNYSGGTLAAGTTCTMTLNATMTVNGNLTNNIPVGAVTTFNGVSNTSAAAASLTNLPGASVSKYFASGSILAGPGNYSLLTITIQNTSSFALTGLGLIDNLPAGLVVAPPPAPAPVNNCGGTLTAAANTQPIQLSGGLLAGNATCTLLVPVNGPLPGTFTNTIPFGALTNNEGTTNTEPASDTLMLTGAPALNVTKTLTSTGPLTPGSTLAYDIVVENTGNISLTGVTVTDPGTGVTLGTCTPAQPATLAPGGLLTCPASHVITQADVDAGSYTNTAVADSDQTPADNDIEVVNFPQNPALEVTKTQTAAGPFALGSTLTYNIVARNAGNITLTGVTITDAGVGVTLGTCTPAQPAALAPGAALTCAATHVVTQADVDAGTYVNTATGDSNQTAPDSDDETVTIAQNPAMNFTKTLTATGPFALGSTLTYDLVVRNTGTVTLTGVTITDPGVGVTLGTCTPAQPAALAPGGTLTCTASHAVAQADVDAGTYANTATADSNQTPPASDTETVTIARNPALTITKRASSGLYTIGDTIPFRIEVTNSGTVTLTGVRITDPGTGVTLGACTPAQPATLAPGGRLACDATHVVTQEDVDAGSYTNTAFGDSDQTPSVSVDETAEIDQTPALEFTKTLISTGPFALGSTLTYDLVARNTGTTTLTNVTITDSSAVIGTCTPTQPAALAPGATLTCRATHVITQADVNAGSYMNTATADSDQTPEESDSETVTIAQTPALTVTKTLTATGPFVLDSTLTYDIVVTNTGNVTLTGVTVTDPGLGVTLGTCTPAQPAVLAPGATLTCPASHVVSQADVEAGTYTNTATGDSDQTPSSSDSETVTIPRSPAVQLEKTGLLDLGSDGAATVGDTITYTFTVTNTGNVVLTNLTLSDALITVQGGPIASLAPGTSDSTTFTGRYTLTQADIDAGSVLNTATVNGTGAGSSVSDTDDDRREIIGGSLLGAAKRLVGAPVSVSPGVWDVTFEILARNYGNVTLDSVQLTDDLRATFPQPTTYTVRSVTSSDFTVNTSFDGAANQALLTGTDTLAVGESGKVTLVVRVIPTSVGPYNNTVAASGSAPDGQSVTDGSQNGDAPDPDSDNDPTNNNDPTPVTFNASLFDPPFGVKVVSETGESLLRWTMTWINNTNIVAINAEAYDSIPEGTAFVSTGAASGYPLPAGAPAGSTTNGVSCVDTSPATSTRACYYEGPTGAYPRGRIVWNGTLGPDFGAADAAAALNEIAISFTVRVNSGVSNVTNTAVIDSDRNGDGDVTDSGEQQVATARESWNRPVSNVKELPSTGFTPGVVSILPAQPAASRYTNESLTLEIPAFNARIPIVGVPQLDKGWDLTWLGSAAGWLNGTAYPTWEGNSVITGHVWDALNKPGPFAKVKGLKYGDEVRIHANGQVYVYAVRENSVVKPNAAQSVLKHEEKAWITLLTCEDYNSRLDTYTNRRIVRAVLVDVIPEK